MTIEWSTLKNICLVPSLTELKIIHNWSTYLFLLLSQVGQGTRLQEGFKEKFLFFSSALGTKGALDLS